MINSIAKRLNSEHAAALVECAIVLPFLLFLFSGALELTRIMSAHERQSLLSREVSIHAWRSCQTAIDSTSNSQCLRQVLLDIEPLLQNLDQSTQLVITTFLREPGGAVARVGAEGYPNNQVVAAHSRFLAAPANGFAGLRKDGDVAIVGEAIGVWQPLFHGLPMGQALGAKWIYEATVY